MNCQQLICMLSTVILLFTLANSEMYTALVDMEKLIFTGSEIVNILESYLKIEEERLDKVKQLKEEFVKLNLISSADPNSFLSNPVNAFLIVKRLTTDWKSAEGLITGNKSQAVVKDMMGQQPLQFPDHEDLVGAAEALVRLQYTYRLDVAALAQGYVAGARSAAPELTAGDCHVLGIYTLGYADYRRTLMWMQEALDRYGEEEDQNAPRVNVLEYMAYASYMLGDIRRALKLTNDMLAIDPSHPGALKNHGYYENAVNLLKDEQRENQFSEQTEIDTGMYEKLCRGEKVKSDIELSKLRCRYHTGMSPYLLLQPAKEEELHLDPRIVVYHDVMSDNEIEVIKDLALPKLKRAGVLNKNLGESSAYRISKSAWLSENESEIVHRVNGRVHEITGLSMNTSELLQVVNYGLGGYYASHWDFAQKDEFAHFDILGTGNRIATWLNYMSDVDAGGATVFPEIGVQVKPEKGSAAFWYNLFENGGGNNLTKHAACPVLAGSKWASNKWIHERGQEFLRPCNLDPTK